MKSENYETYPIKYFEEKKQKSKNLIFLSQCASTNLILIKDLKIFYSPGDICKFLIKYSSYISSSICVLNTLKPCIGLVVKAKDIDKARFFVEKMRREEKRISSMDPLSFEYINSYNFECTKLRHCFESFLNDTNISTDNKWLICYDILNDGSQLFYFPCGHSTHSKCTTKIRNFECPICRYTPTSSYVACCNECQSFDMPFICLECLKSFCSDHCETHYNKTNHA